ncbi:MAG: hypothetical protein EHM58_11735 [Ignavibacteriae bacterium]|nr:MAG: hypothetical protein EHM58_11735 [Ignavibacteriota bacterium]
MEQKKINNLIKNFDKYCNITHNYYRTNRDSSFFYKQILKYHQKSKLKELLKNNQFLYLIYVTLITWDVDSRGASIVSYNTFSESIKKNEPNIIRLSKYKFFNIDLDNNDFWKIIENVFREINIVDATQERKVVGISKALHFLLPHLVMPIDNRYTKKFCGHYNKDNFDKFKCTYEDFIYIRDKLKEKYGNGLINNKEIPFPKLIDDAIIGFIICENDEKEYKKGEFKYILKFNKYGERIFNDIIKN